MDYEKKYKDALEKAGKIHNEHRAQPFDVMLKVFPELKESKDDRIRKALIKYFSEGKEYLNLIPYNKEECVAWLEKQGEQESTDKVEYLIPQKGEYYVCIKDYCPVASNYSVNTKDKIYKSPRNGYINNDKGVGLSWTNSCTEAYFSPVKDEDWIVCENNNAIGEPIQYKTFKSDKVLQKAIKSLEDNNFVIKLRFWTIQDAKDGDILSNGNSIVIFKGIGNERWNDVIDYHIGLFADSQHLVIQKNLSHWGRINEVTVHPATKEQRDLLFQKMSEAGYKWDAKEKQLMKLPRKVQTSGVLKQLINEQKPQRTVSAEAKEAMYSKPAWSEEDEERIKNILSVLDVQVCWNGVTGKKGNPYQKEINWLKSLKSQSQWKPSDEQMEALKSSTYCQDKQMSKVLFELYQDLKKLRED